MKVKVVQRKETAIPHNPDSCGVKPFIMT